MPRISKGLAQAYQLQDLAFEAAMSFRDALPREDGKLKLAREDAQAICSLVKAWESCQERIRIHRNKPMPGSRRPPTAREMRQQERKRKRAWDDDLPVRLRPVSDAPTASSSQAEAGAATREPTPEAIPPQPVPQAQPAGPAGPPAPSAPKPDAPAAQSQAAPPQAPPVCAQPKPRPIPIREALAMQAMQKARHAPVPSKPTLPPQ